MHKVTVNGKLFFCEDGTTLDEILSASGEPAAHPCGGKGICRKCAVIINGKSELSCQYKIYSDITVETAEERYIISEDGPTVTDTASDNLCFILDIGTTAVSLALIDKITEKSVKTVTFANPQAVYGADVISRIEACKKHGVSALQNILIKKISEMLCLFPENRADTLYVSGNTVMLHLFLGEDPTGMGTAPYTPVFLEAGSLTGESIGLGKIRTVYTLPCISAFAGADIVAGLNCTEAPENGRFSLLVDLGTNAEIVLFSAEEYLCTSAAAGPCFEGVGIECGMSASEGAVYQYSSGSRFSTVGDSSAKGICATGLIDIIAVLLKNGIIDKTGFMEEEHFRITDEVYLSKGDIRQFQNAKSAVCSGITTLIKTKGLSYDNIEKVYISGGFAAKMNTDNAVTAGILPEPLKTKCIPLKNTSLQGTARYACKNSDLTKITEKACYTDLSENKYFSKLFINNMLFEDFSD